MIAGVFSNGCVVGDQHAGISRFRHAAELNSPSIRKRQRGVERNHVTTAIPDHILQP
jgi:hypothetical protein